MEKEIIREKLHKIINEMDDQKAEAVYSLLTGEFETDSLRKQLIRFEREKFMLGEGESYSWDEVKRMAIDKPNRCAIKN